jgi:hypothetical protein
LRTLARCAFDTKTDRFSIPADFADNIAKRSISRAQAEISGAKSGRSGRPKTARKCGKTLASTDKISMLQPETA